MHKISLLLSGILFLLGCITLGFAIICSDVLPKIFEIYLTPHPVSYSHSELYIDTGNFYLLSVAELILGTIGYFYNRRKANE